MRPRARGRVLSVVAFVALVADGAAAIWLGQVAGRWPLVVLGVVLLVAAVAVVLLYRRWQMALDELEAARRALRSEVDAMRRAVGRPSGRQDRTGR
jgi:membrane protein implicated in regulation of membrane protease activity